MRFQFMNAFFKYIQSDRILFTGFSISFFLAILIMASIALFYKSLPPFIPLYNQLPWGELRLGVKIAIFTPVLIGLSIVIINCILVSVLYQKIPLVCRILSVTSLLISIFLSLFIMRLIQLTV